MVSNFIAVPMGFAVSDEKSVASLVLPDAEFEPGFTTPTLGTDALEGNQAVCHYCPPTETMEHPFKMGSARN